MKDIAKAMQGSKFHLQPRFTTIYHPIREELGLSVNDYVIIDSIHQLSHKPDHPWCVQSKDAMGEFTGLSRSTVFRAIEEGLNKGLLEKNERGDLRTTHEWYTKVMVYKQKTSKSHD